MGNGGLYTKASYAALAPTIKLVQNWRIRHRSHWPIWRPTV